MGAAQRRAVRGLILLSALCGILPFAACRLIEAGWACQLSACLCYLAALAAGLRLVEPLSDFALGRKIEGWRAWFDRGLADYAAFREREAEREPNPRSKDAAERALAAWRVDVAFQAKSGALPRELFDAAESAGVPFPQDADRASLPTWEDKRASYVSAAAPSKVRWTAFFLALSVGIEVLSTGPAAYSPRFAALLAIECALTCAVAVLALCDERARVLPFEICWALYAFAPAIGLVSGGLHGLLMALAGMLLGALVFSGANLVGRVARGSDQVGAGDRRLAPALCGACGVPGCFVLAIASCLLMAISMLPSLVRHKSGATAKSPLGLWLLAGLGIGLSVLDGGTNWLGLPFFS